MNRFATGLALCLILGAVQAQPRINDQSAARAELAKALAPLNSLTDQQRTAVAALVLAYHAGMPVEDYCPPLKQFAGRERTACQASIVGYASAVRECKKANPQRDCPKVLEAEANWATCEFGALGQKLKALNVVRQWPPNPGPGPDPAP